MNYWIFTVAPYKSDSQSYTARQIYDCRMQDHFWGLSEKAANRKNLRKGDQVVFYSATLEKAFIGTAHLASDCVELSAEEQAKLSHDSSFFTAKYGVWLDAIDVWQKPHRMTELASSLKFVTNPTRWGIFLIGSIRQVEESDYAAIASGSPTSPEAPFRTTEELAAQSLFALEAHLEEFIAHNWSKISWGAELELYCEGDQTGQQYPAGTWSIDFLAVDSKTNELVVIELKRGQTSDATVGQVLRYINWVKKNLAANQNVRGIIVASKIDDSLRYAVIGLSNVSVKTYTVTFSLQAVEICT